MRKRIKKPKTMITSSDNKPFTLWRVYLKFKDIAQFVRKTAPIILLFIFANLTAQTYKSLDDGHLVEFSEDKTNMTMKLVFEDNPNEHLVFQIDYKNVNDVVIDYVILNNKGYALLIKYHLETKDILIFGLEETIIYEYVSQESISTLRANGY